ncbi:15025_t:CDS:2, partial [Acaulospora colombiana]
GLIHGFIESKRVDENSLQTPDDRETWDVEAWRAEIERTLGHSTSSPPSERPKGPRPSSVNAGIPPNMPARHKARSSVDGAVSRRPIERDRDGTMSEDIHSGGGSGREGVLLPRNRNGSISRTSDGLAPRPSISTTASASGTLENQYGRRRSRSRSGSLSHGQPTLAQPPTANTTDNTTSNPMMNMAVPPPVSKYRNDTQAPGHTAGQPSITSVTSTALSSPTSHSSHANTTAFSPMTTTSSLNRSLSEKPLGYHPSHHHQHHHSQPTYGPSYSQGPNAWGGGYKVHHHAGSWSAGGQGGATGVSRSHSATAALPPSSTSSSMTAASFNNYPPNNGNGYPASSGSYAGSNSHLPNGRKPIPAQRRKPVPQHLPATAEVSPFPTLLVVNRESKVVPAAPFEYPAAVDGMDRSAAAPPTIVSISQ